MRQLDKRTGRLAEWGPSVVKCSGEIDLKFGAVRTEQAANFVVDGFLRPGDEVTPMVFNGMWPASRRSR